MHKIAPLAATVLLAACASSHPIEPQIAPASVDFAAATQHRVELSSFDFTPEEIRLSAGQPYELVLVNVSSDGHNFAAPEFFAAAQVQADDSELIASGDVDVPAGASRTIHLVPAAGTYDLVCTYTGHALFGMKGTIVVE